MIPILYDKNETNFNHNGIGFLVDTVKAVVTEERNGSYELSFQYPITGQFYTEIANGAIIKVKANETSSPQLFRIYKISKPLKGIVTYSAEHISYDLNGIPLLGLSINNTTPQIAIARAIENAGLESPFKAFSDISTLNDISIKMPCSVRALLGGQTGSILDVWGGEYEFDNFNIKLHAHRGDDNGVLIEYGKNLQDLKQESNIAECYTHLMPYASYNTKDESSGETETVNVYLTEKVIPLTQSENIGHNKAYIMDFSEYFGDNEEITEDKLRTKAIAYAAATELGTPKVSITVSFVQLWKTEEYKNIAPLERVKMCDTVTVRFSKLGVTAKAKIIKTVYDTLREKYESITLGDAKSSFADTVNEQQGTIGMIKNSVKRGQAQAVEELKKAILNATNLITGHSGGYVVLNPAEKPQEILILDAPNIKEAVRVWRWNSGGLGFSETGYNGKYSTAITMDGSIVADFITAGTLQGVRIIADDGKIGGWNIENSRLYDINNPSAEAGINQYGYGAAFYAGANNDVSGNNACFRVFHDGRLYANSADIQGKITADDGKIGGWNVGQYGISKTSYIWVNDNTAFNYRTAIQSFNNGTSNYPSFYVMRQDFDAQNEVWNDSEMTYYVSPTGYLFAKNATITGNINANIIYANSDIYITNGDFNYPVKMLHANITGSDDTEYDVGRCSKNGFNTYNFIRFYESSQYRYAEFHNNGIYASVLGTSDERLKNSIETLPDKYYTFFQLLSPKRFKYNNGTSDRYHIGFIAQDVLEAMKASNIETSEFAGFVKGNFSPSEKEKYNFDEPLALKYDEFIALNTMIIQAQSKKIDNLEKRIKNLEKALN